MTSGVLAPGSRATLKATVLPRIPALDKFRIQSNSFLQTVVGSPTMVTIGQFFIRDHPLLTSVSDFTGSKTASEIRLNEPDAPSLPDAGDRQELEPASSDC